MSIYVRPPRFAVGRYLLAALLSISLLFLPRTAAAQVSGAGAISGTVTDSTGAVIPGATVTTINTATSVSVVRKSTSTGYYVVSPLLPGSYSIVVSSPGFQDLKQENVTVNALQTLSFNPKLAIGNATETVTVSTAPPALQTSNATLGAVMENKTYSELPLLMSQAPRDPTAFVQLMPGVSAGGRAGIFGGVGSGNMNEMYIEGVPLTTVDSQGDNRKINQNLSVDAVDQFQVQTSGSSAQYQGIGVENFSVKQGSNTFHGNASDFIRNTAFDSWGFLQKSVKIHNADGSTSFAPKPPEHQNELSASLSGPIHRDRIFFFVNYDRYHYNAVSSPSLQTIPTTDFRQGDFSALVDSKGKQIPIYDPTTLAACTAANHGTTCAYQFMGLKNGIPTRNVIPAGQISSISQAMQKFLPPVSNSSISNNYLYGYPTGRDNWEFTGRVDFNVGNKQQITLISTSGVRSFTPLDYGATTTLPAPYTNGTIVSEPTTTAIIKHTYTFNPHMVNQFRYGYTRYWATIKNATDGNTAYGTGQSLGIGNIPAGLASTTFPGVKFSGPTDNPSSWSAPGGNHEAVNTYTIADDLQWIRGKHSFTFGGDFQWLQFNQSPSDSPSNPLSLSFKNTSTSGYDAKGNILSTNTGFSYASYLLGAVDSSSLYVQSFSTLGARYKAFSPYIQDDYKVTQKLTLNLGLRWDLYTPYHETGNRWSTFSPTLVNPATGTPGAISYIGHGVGTCNCTTPVRTWYRNFGPRVGGAYQITSRDVVRGAFSIMYTHNGGVGGSNAGNYNGTGQIGLTASPNFTDSGQGGQPAFYLNSAMGNTSFPSYSTTPDMTASANAGNYLNGSGAAITAAGANYADPYLSGRPPYTENWNFGVQHLLTNDLTLSVDYAGSQSHFLVGQSRGYYQNQLAPAFQVLGPLLKQLPGSIDKATGKSYLQEAQAVIPSIQLPYASYGGPSATIGQMLKPFPQYSSVTDTWGDIGNGNYNALEITLNQRQWHGLSATLNYTWSKQIDDLGGYRSGYPIPGNVIDGGHAPAQANRIDRANTSVDPQSLHIFGVYALPIGGPGQLGSSSLPVRILASGWKLSSIFNKVAGAGLSVAGTGCNTPGSCYPSYNPAFTGPERINGGYGHGVTAANINSIHYLDANGFLATPGNAGYNFGDAPRMSPYGIHNIANYSWDAGIRRVFPIHERLNFTFQADCSNVTNHVQFGGLGVSLASSSFGTISKQNNNPRDWQFAGKINF
jgi:hypothetical protein